MSGVRQRVMSPSVEFDAARARPPQPHDGAQRRGLAGAVAAKQHGQLALAAPRDRRRAGCDSGRYACARLAAVSSASLRHGPADAEIGFLHDRRRHHLGRRAVGHQRALVQHDHAVGEAAHHLHLVLDQQDRLVAAARLIASIRSRITGTSSTLMPAVGSSNMKTSGSSASRIATSSLRWSPWLQRGRRRSRARRQLHPLETAPCARSRQIGDGSMAMPRKCEADAGARLHGEADVLQHGEIGEQVGELERPAEPAPRAQRRRQAGDVARRASSTSPALARNWPEIRLK